MGRKCEGATAPRTEDQAADSKIENKKKKNQEGEQVDNGEKKLAKKRKKEQEHLADDLQKSAKKMGRKEEQQSVTDGTDDHKSAKKQNSKKKENGFDSDQKSAKKKRNDKQEAVVDTIDERDGQKLPKQKKSKSKENRADDEQINGDVARIDNLQVSVSGRESSDPKFKALESFTAANLPESVLKCCIKFKKPSPIQAHSWPFLLHGRDLIGIAATGSGKTLAFGVPAVMHVLNKRDKRNTKKPLCLVLSPTRELAQQIAVVLEEAGADSKLKVVCLYGGSAKGPQEAALRSGSDIIVATPGRLQDFVDGGACNLEHVNYLVLDEADRMLDLGFEPAVRAIVQHIPKERQTLMFSATWPVAVEKLAQEFIRDPSPVKITIGSEDLAANHDVTQIVEVLDDRARDARLEALLKLYHKTKRNRILVFVLYKKEAVRVERVLGAKGWKVTGIHGDKSQQARNQALSAFKDGSHPLLIATDVAARGLDIPDVEYVINYSFPLTTEDYVHRIGRTGRAGKKGIAHTFFTTNDKARAGELVNILREAGQTVPEELLKFGTHVKKKESKLYGAHFRELAADAPKAQKITFDSDEEAE